MSTIISKWLFSIQTAFSIPFRQVGLGTFSENLTFAKQHLSLSKKFAVPKKTCTTSRTRGSELLLRTPAQDASTIHLVTNFLIINFFVTNLRLKIFCQPMADTKSGVGALRRRGRGGGEKIWTDRGLVKPGSSVFCDKFWIFSLPGLWIGDFKQYFKIYFGYRKYIKYHKWNTSASYMKYSFS